MADAPLSGTLADTSLGDVLAGLSDGRHTGVLRIQNDDPASEIWLDGGRIAYIEKASGPKPVEVLFGAGLGSVEQINQMLRDGEAANALADADPNGAGALGRQLHEHNLNLLFELLVPSEAAFEFEAEQRHPVGARFAEHTPDLLAQARRRLEIWAEIAGHIPSTDAVFTLSRQLPDGAAERVVTADEWRYLSLLDGRRTIGEVIAETGVSAFRVVSSLYRMVLEGLVEEPDQT